VTEASDAELVRQLDQRRAEHGDEHERERIVAKETAQRLEREVEQTALRLERVVEETAIRIENAVETALKAVAETARVHSDAHNKEHLAHERIHNVEKEQVDKAELAQKERDKIQADSLAEYKQANNEWGRTVRELTSNFPQRLEVDAKFDALNKDVRTNVDAIRELRETVLTQFSAQSGKSEGLSSTAKTIVGIAAFIVSVLTIVLLVQAFTR
jgi:hypothetical protein